MAEAFTYENLSKRTLAGQYRYLAARLACDRPQDDVQAHSVASMLETMAYFADRAERATPAQVFTKGDPEPEVRGGTIAVVNYGDYRTQEVWVASGANIGCWYPLGGEFWAVWDRKRHPPGVTREHPTWDDVTARGPVTLVAAMPQEAYQQGWADGRRRLLEQVEELRDEEGRVPGMPHA